MMRLGFPTDAINVIANLYTNATTRIKLPAGMTYPIDINRGTIQGDTLSPLLFLIFIEPLLRWLHSGGQYGCLQRSLDADHTTSSMAYADDLNILTTCIKRLILQAQKVEAFTSWAGMKVNCKKCGTTGMLYGCAKNKVVDNVLGFSTIKMLKTRLDRVKIQGEGVPFHHPHTEPYTYLGVEITPTMNWSYQLDKMINTVRNKGEKLHRSMLSYRQNTDSIHTVTVPSATYAFP